MRKVLVVTATVALLAACGSETSGEFTTEDGGEGTYSADVSTGEGEISVSTEDGEMNAQVGSGLSVDLPEGFSLPAGSNVISNMTVDSGEGSNTQVMFLSPMGREELMQTMRAQVEAAGIVISNTIDTPDMYFIGGEGPDKAVFSFQASDSEEGGSTGSLTIGKAGQ